MIIRAITILLLVIQISVDLSGQDVNLDLADSLKLDNYYQEIVVNLNSLPDSSMISISHITKHANDSTYRMAVRRHISFYGELLSLREYELSRRAGFIGYFLESYNFISHFSNSNIFLLAMIDTEDCNDESAPRFKLVKMDQIGNVISEKYWCRDIFTRYSELFFSESDSTLYTFSYSGTTIYDRELELSTLKNDFTAEIEIVKIKSKDSSLKYLNVKNDTIFAAGTFNPNDTFYGPKTTWSGYILEDSIIVAHEFYYFDDWLLSELIWQSDHKQYIGISSSSDASLLNYKNNKLEFNVFEGYYSALLPLTNIESGFIVPYYSHADNILNPSKQDPIIGFYVLENTGFIKEKIDYEIADLLYISEYIRIEDRLFVFAKMIDSSQSVRHKTHCYIFDLEE